MLPPPVGTEGKQVRRTGSAACPLFVAERSTFTGQSDKIGNFSSQLDELVKHFPGEAAHRPQPKTPSELSPARCRLQEKIDIHARLFELAWTLECVTDKGSAA